MRYIGSKVKLCEAISRLATDKGLRPGGTVFDIFSGTAAVGRHMKALGHRVVSNDRLMLSYVLQRALVVAEPGTADLTSLARALERARPRCGLVTRQYSPDGEASRRFFHPQQARAIDAALERLTRWRRAGDVDDDTFFLLLAGLLVGAGKIANISGTYGAYLKEWQPNALYPFRIAPLVATPGALRCEAHQADANVIVKDVQCDLLYIDPPYNRRDYAANYHVLDAMANRPFLDARALAKFEKSIYGKSGLAPYERSAYCSLGQVPGAFRDLIANCRAEHVIVSYSEEGFLSRAEIEEALADGLGVSRDAVTLQCVDHRRFRSDRNRDGKPGEGAVRRYQQLAGRARDGIQEWLFHCARAKQRARRSVAHRASAAEVRG